MTLIGSAALIGWFLDISALTQLAPGMATMKLNTAASLVLLGAGVAFGVHARVALVASVVVVVIATATLTEYATSSDLGIDEALVRDLGGGTTHPGRMAVTTAVCLLLGAASALAARRGRDSVVTALSVPMLILGWLGCLGYLYGVEGLYRIGPLSTMAGHTAFAVVILGIGLLASAPNSPLSWILDGDDPGALLLRRLVPVIIVGLPLVGRLLLVGEHAGWYDSEIGLALMVIVASAAVLGVAFRTARSISIVNSIRSAIDEELRELNATLSSRIERRTAELTHLADHDPLTGLLNRRSFRIALDNHAARSKRYGPTGALLIIDIDNFKQINDTHGHDIGDQVIVTIADVLRARLRESDLVARLGGDEFAVLMPEGAANDAYTLAGMLVVDIRASSSTVAVEQRSLSASIGVAVFDSIDRSVEAMLINADSAMYKAKVRGRDRWAEFAGTNRD